MDTTAAAAAAAKTLLCNSNNEVTTAVSFYADDVVSVVPSCVPSSSYAAAAQKEENLGHLPASDKRKFSRGSSATSNKRQRVVTPAKGSMEEEEEEELQMPTTNKMSRRKKGNKKSPVFTRKEGLSTPRRRNMKQMKALKDGEEAEIKPKLQVCRRIGTSSTSSPSNYNKESPPAKGDNALLLCSEELDEDDEEEEDVAGEKHEGHHDSCTNFFHRYPYWSYARTSNSKGLSFFLHPRSSAAHTITASSPTDSTASSFDESEALLSSDDVNYLLGLNNSCIDSIVATCTTPPRSCTIGTTTTPIAAEEEEEEIEVVEAGKTNLSFLFQTPTIRPTATTAAATAATSISSHSSFILESRRRISPNDTIITTPSKLQYTLGNFGSGLNFSCYTTTATTSTPPPLVTTSSSVCPACSPSSPDVHFSHDHPSSLSQIHHEKEEQEEKVDGKEAAAVHDKPLAFSFVVTSVGSKKGDKEDFRYERKDQKLDEKHDEKSTKNEEPILMMDDDYHYEYDDDDDDQQSLLFSFLDGDKEEADKATTTKKKENDGGDVIILKGTSTHDSRSEKNISGMEQELPFLFETDVMDDQRKEEDCVYYYNNNIKKYDHSSRAPDDCTRSSASVDGITLSDFIKMGPQPNLLFETEEEEESFNNFFSSSSSTSNTMNDDATALTFSSSFFLKKEARCSNESVATTNLFQGKKKLDNSRISSMTLKEEQENSTRKEVDEIHHFPLSSWDNTFAAAEPSLVSIDDVFSSCCGGWDDDDGNIKLSTVSNIANTTTNSNNSNKTSVSPSPIRKTIIEGSETLPGLIMDLWDDDENVVTAAAADTTSLLLCFSPIGPSTTNAGNTENNGDVLLNFEKTTAFPSLPNIAFTT